MSFYTEQAKTFKFPALPGQREKRAAYIKGFTEAVSMSQLTPTEKLAWLKYAAAMPPGAPEEAGEAHGGGAGQEGPEAELQELLMQMPGNSIEEKVHALMSLLQHAGGQGGQGGPPVQGPQ